MNRERFLAAACFFGHTEFVKYRVNEIQNDSNDINNVFEAIGVACMEVAASSGYADTVEVLLSLGSRFYTGDKCTSSLRPACYQENTTILSIFFSAFENHDFSSELKGIFRSLCLQRNGDIVRTLSNFEPFTSKLKSSWKVDGINSGVWNGVKDNVTVLIEKLESWELVGACEAALEVVLGYTGGSRGYTGQSYYGFREP
ncbi:hypothetical protein HDU76_008805, partial [Blyttiomyces sp. JEL0837]